MSVIETAGWVELHRKVARQLRCGTAVDGLDVRALLREGWDYVGVYGTPEHEPLGIYRAPHLAILANLSAKDMPGKPILAIGMNVWEIESGLYRQCRITPEPLEIGLITDKIYKVEEEESYDPTQAWIFRALTGHSLRDLALFLHDQLSKDPEVGKLLLAKDFKGALWLEPAIISADWPPSVKASWEKLGGKDHLSPLVALSVHAELARLAITDVGMIDLSFDNDGKELTTKGLLEGIEPLAIEMPGTSTLNFSGWSIHKSAVDRLVEMMAFQTPTLLPPTSVFANRDIELGKKWSFSVARTLSFLVAEGGPQVISAALQRRSDYEADRLRRNMAAHPKFWPEGPKNKKPWIHKRAAAEYWKLDRWQNVAVGIVEITSWAQAWSAKHRPASKLKKEITKQRIGNAMQMLGCLWLESGNSKAVAARDEQMRGGYVSDEANESTVYEEDTLDDIRDRAGFGQGMMRSAQKYISKRASPGSEGYSARYMPHLWYTSLGSDLEFYKEKQALAVADHLENGRQDFGPDFGPVMTNMFRGKGLPPNVWMPMTMDNEAAYCAQDYAMMVTSQGLDPIRSFLDRPEPEPL